MPTLSVVRAGLFTTVQDLGRWGSQSVGVPVGGAMDPYSHRAANRLVDNDDHEATLEITFVGPEIAFEEDITFAITGASFFISLDGTPVDMHRSVDGRRGSVLKFGERQRGARAYLAVRGGIDVPCILGSRSTHVLTRMGGVERRALRAGDRLERRTGTPSPALSLRKRSRPLFLPEGGARLRVIPGEPRLSDHLLSRRFRISPQSNRMGYRLEGPPSPSKSEPGFGGAGEPIADAPAGELISKAVATGAVQLPPTGQPILLMVDHATTGGYAIGATVITADLPLAAQLAPGDWIEFETCTLAAADKALRDQEASLGSA